MSPFTQPTPITPAVPVLSAAPAPSAEPSPSAKPERMRLDFLDGMRGLAALYVMLAHVFSITAYEDGKISESLPPVFVFLTRGLNFPHYAVAVFIVLSGFCLMLPVARAKDRSLPGGLRGFVRRRARRILPPYYVALTCVLGILFASHSLVKHTGGGATDLSAMDVGTHILLIHNLFERYSMQIDIPMWSVAWEWQIYFVFALVLLPVWRRLGMAWTVVLGFALGLAPLLLLPSALNLQWTSPWYLGLFALGMAAAVLLSAPRSAEMLARNAARLRTVLVALAAVLLAAVFFLPEWLGNQSVQWVVDTYLGAFTALFILACAGKTSAGGLHRIVAVLESRPLMTLGAFSYSLYLIHFPLLIKLGDILRKHQVSHGLQFAVLLLVGVPVCLGAAYLFHLAFERPFMPGRPKTERQAEQAALVSPAP